MPLAARKFNGRMHVDGHPEVNADASWIYIAGTSSN